MKTETIYVDSLNHCYRIDDGTMTAVETDFFDGMCDTFVEGYCYEIKKNGITVYPWKPYSELDAAQREYERWQLEEMQETIAETEAAEAAYREGVQEA